MAPSGRRCGISTADFDPAAYFSSKTPKTVTVQLLVSITRFGVVSANLVGMDRAAAEAVYDQGREGCVAFLLELTSAYDAQIAGLEERLRRLEVQARQDSRTSSAAVAGLPNHGSSGGLRRV